MLLTLGVLGLSLLGWWTAYSWYCLWVNYISARKIGVPLRVMPISHENPLWMIVDKKVFHPPFQAPAIWFRKSYPFQGSNDKLSTNVATSYKESLQTILDNCILLMVLGTKTLSKDWQPSKLKKLHQAVVTFKQYMTEVYETEKKAIAEGKSTGKNLMTSLVRASQENATLANGDPSQESGGLTES
jgi:hypothetical protein